MPRFNPTNRPEAIKPLFALEAYVDGCGLEPDLVHLILMRVSQLNGCAWCLDMHSKDARAAGETQHVCICCKPGARRRCTAHANVPRRPGARW